MARRRRRTNKTSTGGFLILLLLAAGVYLYQEGYLDKLLGRIKEELPPQATQTTTSDRGDRGLPAPTPATELEKAASYAGSWAQIYFTRPDYPERREGRQGGIDSAIVADFDAAKQSIDVAVFELDLPSFGEALVRAHERGVRVRLVTDDGNLDDPEMAEIIGEIEQAGIQVTFDQRDPFMHNKFAIIDEALVWAGSMNFTANDVYRNNNNMLRFTAPALRENYQRRFDHMIGGMVGAQAPKDTPNPKITLDNGVTIENYFSPGSGADKVIERRLQGATRRIRVLAFSFTADGQANALVQKHGEGIEVQGVFDGRNVEGTGADFGMLKNAGLDVHEDGNCYVQHNKIYIIDDQTVITGSYNFSANAERSNDEHLLIIDDPALAAIYNAEFDRIYDQALNPTKCGG